MFKWLWLSLCVACIGISLWPQVESAHFYSELLGQAKLQIAALLAFLAIVSLFAKRILLGLVLVSVAGWHGWVIASALAGPPQIQSGTRQQLTVMHFNMFANNFDASAIEAAVAKVKPDMVMLVETNSETFRRLQHSFLAEFPYQLPERRDEFDAATTFFSRYPIPGGQSIFTVNPRSQLGVFHTPVTVNEQTLDFYGMHTASPRSEYRVKIRNQQLLETARYIRAHHDGKPMIVAGDMNTSPWNDAFRVFMQATGVYNSDRISGVNGTWPTWLPKPLRIPIDHVLVNRGFCGADSHTLLIPGSDHLAVVAKLTLCS